MELIKHFCKLSYLITGFYSLPENQVSEYFHKISKADGYKTCLPNLILIAASVSNTEELIEKLDVDQKRCCKGIAFLWFTSEFIEWESLSTVTLPAKRQPGNEEEYYSALLWKTIRAHPPGLTGGYYGHWKYEPEN